MKSNKESKKHEYHISKYLNLTIKEQKAMQELQSINDIIITDANKGGTVVILHVEDCLKEAERQLNNKKTTKKTKKTKKNLGPYYC